jgi:paraquat-inducible protein B
MLDTENKDNNEAHIKESNAISKAWIVPLVALSIGLWMVYYQWANQGPLITIEFSTAEGLEADKTKIKTRDVDIGVVKKIELKPDLTGVIVTARIEQNAASLLREGSNFWIVTPRISLSGVTGLSTLLSGPYITMEPSETGEEALDYIALPEPPVTPDGADGLHITLNSDDEFAFKAGDPIIYKGLKVGEFDSIYFNLEERIVYYNAFIEAPYNKLITENTKFWNVSGVRFDLEAGGIKVQTGSLETLLTNGVTFGIPEGMASGNPITDRAFFDIFPNYEAAVDERYKLGVNFVIMIDDTVRGLTVGAPVEYRGLEVGEVIEINPPGPINQGLLDVGYPIPVIISVQPRRIQQPDNQQGMDFVLEQTLHWIDKGFRATLKTGNILTGALFVDLQHYPDAEPAQLGSYLGYHIIPTRSNEFAQLTQKASDMLDTINRIPFEKLSKDAELLLGELNTTVKTFDGMGSNLNQILDDVQQRKVAENLNKTVQSLDTLLKDFSSGSKSHSELLSAMQQFQTTFKELTPLLQQLNRNPNSLIFAEGVEPKIEPKAFTENTDSGEDNE